MKKSRIKLLIFDFDGTISDARRLAYSNMIYVLDKRGYKYDKKKARKLLGDKMQIIFRKLKIPLDNIQEIRKEFYKRMVIGVKKGGIKLCSSISPLKKLKKKYKLIIITNSESSFLNASIKKLRVGGLFHEILPAEKFTSKDKALKSIFKEYKIHPKEAVYIGDRFSDVIFARKAGCIAIAIHNSCSWSTRKEVLAEKPDFLISDFDDLEKILEK